MRPAPGFAAIGVLLAVAAAAAQGSVFRARTELSLLNVSVHDRQGHVVQGLTADRFEIREDDVPRAVAALATGDEPLSLVVAVDVSESMAGPRFEAARQAVTAFFAARRPDDEYFVLAFNERVFPIAPGSQSIEVIQRGFDRVTPMGTTAFYAAVTTAIDSLRASVNRRRAVVMISDGNDFRMSDMRTPQDAFDRRSRALERVQRSEALVYAIGIDAPLPGPVTPDKMFDANALRTLTEPTGAMTVIARSSDGVPTAAQAIVDDLRQQYVLGFEPAHQDDGRFHRLTVTVSGCDCRVRARRGFVAVAMR